MKGLTICENLHISSYKLAELIGNVHVDHSMYVAIGEILKCEHRKGQVRVVFMLLGHICCTLFIPLAFTTSTIVYSN